VWVAVDHRLHRIVQAVTLRSPGQGDIQLRRIYIVAVVHRCAGVDEQLLLQGGQREYVSDPHVAARGRRSSAGRGTQAQPPM
jgi:hypothetical protein